MINITVKLSSGKEIILTEEEYTELISLFSRNTIQSIPIPIPYSPCPTIPWIPPNTPWYQPTITWTSGSTWLEGKVNP